MPTKNLWATVARPMYYFVSLTPEAMWGGKKSMASDI